MNQTIPIKTAANRASGIFVTSSQYYYLQLVEPDVCYMQLVLLPAASSASEMFATCS